MISQYEPIFNKTTLNTNMSTYIQSGGWFTEFKETKKFEDKIKKTLNTKHAICVNNGTISLSLALLAEGIKAGDHVLVPALSMIATANAVRLIGAIPLFIDIEEKYLCLDLELTKKAILEYHGIKGVIYVSLNGRSHEDETLKEFYAFCQERKIAFIEDAAQSFGSERTGVRIGDSPWISSFSFSPAKIITTGQGGCLTTNDSEKALKIKRLKDFGRESGGADIHDYFGINSKFTDLQAVVGLEQIRDIEQKIKNKKAMFNIYKKELGDCCKMLDNSTSVTPWFIDGYFDRVDELSAHLEQFEGIKTRRVYPAITNQLIYSSSTAQVPVAEKYSSMGLWLPSSLNLSYQQILHVCNSIKQFLARKEV